MIMTRRAGEPRMKGVLFMVLAAVAVGGCTATEPATPAVEDAAATQDEEAGELDEPAEGAGDETATDPEPEEAEPSEVPSPSPEPLPEATPLEDAAVGEQPDDGWELMAGLYSSQYLEGVALTVPDGTRLRVFKDESFIFFADEFTGNDAVWATRITGVVPPEQVGTHPPHGEMDAFLTDVPEDLGAWLDAIPQLEVMDRGEVAGSHRWWDIRVVPELGDTFSDCGRPHCIATFGEPEGQTTFIQSAEWVTRLAQPIDAPTVVLWSQETSTGPAAAFVDALVEGLVVRE